MACCALLGLAAGTAAGADDPWPTFQGNDAHTGYVPGIFDPSAFALRWTRTINAGIALNPVATGEGKVFVSEDTYFNNGGLYMLDAASGNLLWNVNYGDVFSVNPPSYAYGNVYIQAGDQIAGNYLHAYQAATGVLVFRSAFGSQWERYYAPTIYDGNVYVDGGEYGGMYSFNATNGSQNWFGYVGQYDGWTPAVDTNYCYVFTGSGDTTPITGQFRIIDRSSGITRYLVTDNAFQWDGYTMDAAVALGTNSDAFAINEPGSVYPNYSANGRLLMFDLRADGPHTPHIGWVLSDHFTGQPTLANGVLYVNDGGSLAALDEVTGSTLWTWTPPAGSLTDTMIATDNLLLAGTGAATYAVDLVSHQTLWSYPVSGHLALGEGVLYIAAGDGSLTAINAASANPVTNHPPVCRIGGPYTAECLGAATVVQLDGSGSSDPDGNPLTFSWSTACTGASFDNPASPTPTLTMSAFAAQVCTVTLVVSDGQLSNSGQATVTVVDTTPPILTCASNKVVECGSSWSFDPPSASDACCGTNVTLTVLGTVTNGSASNVGSATMTRIWLATDCSGNTNTCSQTVTVVDTTPPVIGRVTATPCVLWPPDNKMVDVTINYSLTDACDPTSNLTCTLDVTSNEKVTGHGDDRGVSGRKDKDRDDKDFDWVIVDSHHVRLRAERTERGHGRIYWITVTCTDSSGNSASKKVAVIVPKSKGRDS